MRRFILPIICLIPAVSPAVTVSFQNGINGYSGEHDTFLDNGSPNTNYQTNGVDIVGPASSGEIDRTLIRFDLSSIAGKYSAITQLQLTFSDLFGVGTNTINLNEVDALNSDWEDTLATWNYKKPTPFTTWDGGLGLGTTGYSSALASQTFDSSTANVVFTITGTAATNLVNDFTNGNNAGFLLKTVDESPGDNYILLWQGTNGTVENNPTLTVTYTPTPEPSTVCLLIGSLAALGQRRARRK